VQVPPASASPDTPSPVGQGSLLERLPKEQATIIELAPPKQLNVKWPMEFVQRVEAAGADAISLPENPLARIRMDGFLLAQHLKGACNLPLIPHLTCRDRNVLGLHSTLMGGAIAGLDGVLAVTGDPLNPEARQGRSVYDISSTGLVRMIAEMNAGRTLAGADLKGHSNYSVGVAYSTSAPNMEKETDRLVQKLDAGGQFVMTQPVFTSDEAKQMLDRLDERKITARVFVGVYPLLSTRSAWFMHHQVPGVEIPAKILDRLSSVADDSEAQRETGLAEYRQLRGELAKLKADIYLICPPSSGGILESLLEK
jgi:5,10-methylenetetrahydrofolate reductase